MRRPELRTCRDATLQQGFPESHGAAAWPPAPCFELPALAGWWRERLSPTSPLGVRLPSPLGGGQAAEDLLLVLPCLQRGVWALSAQLEVAAFTRDVLPGQRASPRALPPCCGPSLELLQRPAGPGKGDRHRNALQGAVCGREGRPFRSPSALGFPAARLPAASSGGPCSASGRKEGCFLGGSFLSSSLLRAFCSSARKR